MADRNLSFRIGASDDASAVIAKLSKAAGKDLRDVDEALDDTRTSGKRMADALTAVADELDDELKGTARAADRLAEALGPDFSSKLNDGDLDRFVNDLRAAGLTIDDIEQEADELAAALKRMDEVQSTAAGRLRRSFDDVDGSIRQVGDSADQSRSVVANFAGNASQDMGELAGITGSAGVALGQFAEYGTEANISLKNLALAAGPLAIATLVIQRMGAEAQKVAQVRAFNADQVREWADAMGEGADAAEAMAESFRDAGKVEFGLDLGPLSNITDVTEDMAALGVTVDQFAQLAARSPADIERWGDSMLDAGADGDALTQVLVALGIAHNQQEAAARAAAIAEQVGITATDDAAEATERLARAHERARGEIDRQRAAYDRMAAARAAATGDRISVERAQNSLERAQQRLAEVNANSEASALDRRDAELDVEEALIAVGEAWRSAAENTAIASGRAQEATEDAASAQIAALQAVAAELDEDSPQRRFLDSLIWDLTLLKQASDRLYERPLIPLKGDDAPSGPAFPDGVDIRTNKTAAAPVVNINVTGQPDAMTLMRLRDVAEDATRRAMQVVTWSVF